MTDPTEVCLTAVDGHEFRGDYRPADVEVGQVLLTHGILSDRRGLGYHVHLGDMLSGRGYSTLAIDYRGHGASTFGLERLSIAGLLLDISASWSYLAQTGSAIRTRRIIVGHSFSAGAAYLFGMQEAAVDAVFLSMPVLSYVNDIGRVNPSWASELSNGSIRYAHAELPPTIVPEMYVADHMIEQLVPSKPYTILHGKSDSDVPFAESVAFVSRHPGGRLVGLPDMDHSWAAPGDTERESNTTRKNQVVAAMNAADLLTSLTSEPI